MFHLSSRRDSLIIPHSPIPLQSIVRKENPLFITDRIIFATSIMRMVMNRRGGSPFPAIPSGWIIPIQHKRIDLANRRLGSLNVELYLNLCSILRVYSPPPMVTIAGSWLAVLHSPCYWLTRVHVYPQRVDYARLTFVAGLITYN